MKRAEKRIAPFLALVGMGCVVLAPLSLSAQALCPCSPDAVHLDGWIGKKMDRFFQERIFSPFAREVVFGEARAAFAMKMDDASGVGGYWQGEFWRFRRRAW